MSDITNKFESRATTAIINVNKFIIKTQEDLRKNLDETALFKDQSESLARLIVDQEPIVVEAIKTKQETIDKRLLYLGSNKTSLESTLANYRIKLSILQEVCPHLNSKFDHEDHHNNTTYDKCELCNKVF